MKALLRTSDRVAPLILRLTLGLVMLPHGLQKTFGLFGGPGYQGAVNMFTERMGIPLVFALLAIAAEFLGPLGLICGLLTRVAAFGIAVEMMVAAYKAHIQNGFFMNWMGTQRGEGFEYHILVLGIAIAIMIEGAGRFSLDGLLTRGRLVTSGSGS
jgi:putative oxidoreductase